MDRHAENQSKLESSIIHIFFRDGMIYFAIIFGAVRLLVRELEGHLY
jgi:hypothetical protein